MSLTFSITNYPTGISPSSVAIGDLNGDGHLDLAVANFGDPSGFGQNGTVSVFLGSGGGTFSAATRYSTQTGFAGAQSVAIGDLNGDGKLDLAVADASNKVPILFGNGDGSFNVPTPPTFTGINNPGSVAIADLNGDGRLDLALANFNTAPGSAGTVTVLFGQVGGGFTRLNLPTGGANASSVAIGDLNGDGKLDLAVANLGSNNVTVLLSPNAPPDHDFNGDGNSDVLWRHETGQVYFWDMNGLQTNGEGSVAHAPVPNDWHVQGSGDFNGDGKSDILWRHDSGQVYFWEMDGLAIKAEGGVAHAPVPNDWHIQGLGDFNGDGKSDILWRHDSGQVYFWEMDGLGIKAEGGVAHALVPNDWHIQGLGDFDGDGNSDILWRQDTGQVYIWEMDGLNIKMEGAIAHAPVGTDWHVQDIGDYNNDGKSGDILWRHDSGQVYVWEMNGLGITAEGAVSHAPVPSDWHIFSQNNFV